MKRDPAAIGQDILAALGLLTRLPLPGHRASGASAAWAWPLVGAVVGTLAATIGAAALAAGFGVGAVAALVLAAQAMLTGAMHEDGLADTADGLWGGWTRARRLEIMRDSHIGSYGVLALILVMLIRWSALSALIGADMLWPAVIAAAVLSRVPMAVMIAALPNARGSGLSQSVGQPSSGTALVACGLGLAVAVLVAGPSAALWMVLVGALPCVALALVARARIGGQTGDILGASQQLTEAAALAAFAATLA